MFVGVSALGLLASIGAHTATKTVDLDGNPANGAESQCDLNVLQTFPVQVENRVTNKSGGDSFGFSWPSAGPGGFTSSITAGTPGGVGAKWVWTTNQSVFSYTGNSCANDVCFTKTGGPDPIPSACSLRCVDDGVALTIGRGASASETALSWPGGTGPFTIFRSTTPQSISDPGNALTTTSSFQYTDVLPAGSIFYYQVRVPVCLARKPCSSDADCNPVTDGTCVSRGPFGVPGRSLLASNVTVSSASLTASLITFFSPPQEIFRVTSSVKPLATGIAYQLGLQNMLNVDVTAIQAAYPPGCCNAPNQLNCNGTCVDYLSDNANCGACGNDCGEGYHCDSGTCRITCTGGTIDCDGVCVDPKNDRNNCGGCGNTCNSNAVCISSACYDCYGPNDIVCDNECIDPNNDPHNCQACGVDCDLLCEAPQVGACHKDNGCYCTSPGLASVSTPGPLVPSAPHLRASAPQPLAPAVVPAPICELPSTTTLVPAGGTTTECELRGVLSKEVPTSIAICGVGIPDGNARCANGDPATQGTFMKLLPDLTKPIGDAYVTPLLVHVTDVSNDGLIQSGETVQIVVEVLNAGTSTIFGANATLVSPPVDLTDDGVSNPVGVTISTGAVPFGDIIGTPAGEGDCTAVQRPLEPAKNLTPYQVTFLGHPGDTSRPFTLQFAGIVNGSPFSMDMPISLGVADTCDFSQKSRDFDGLDGLLEPMAKLVPLGDPVPLPHKNFKEDHVVPLALRQLCGGVDLTGDDVDPPQIIGLAESKLGPLDITALTLNNDTGDSNPFFTWDDELGQWVYNIRTTQLGTGRFTLTIRIASRKEYAAAFILETND
jgi:hypothetical protein